jgi:hypothetical protein
VPPDHRARVVRRTADRSDVAILCIHGFGAARQEGEAVVDAAAEALAANVVYMRLPGHGAGAEAHARARATDYLDGGGRSQPAADDAGCTGEASAGQPLVEGDLQVGGPVPKDRPARGSQGVQPVNDREDGIAR